MFKRPFRKNGERFIEDHVVHCNLYNAGVIHLSTYMKVYKVGDIVDVKVKLVHAP